MAEDALVTALEATQPSAVSAVAVSTTLLEVPESMVVTPLSVAMAEVYEPAVAVLVNVPPVMVSETVVPALT